MTKYGAKTPKYGAKTPDNANIVVNDLGYRNWLPLKKCRGRDLNLSHQYNECQNRKIYQYRLILEERRH